MEKEYAIFCRYNTLYQDYEANTVFFFKWNDLKEYSDVRVTHMVVFTLQQPCLPIIIIKSQILSQKVLSDINNFVLIFPKASECQ